jgi:hypothetical protein
MEKAGPSLWSYQTLSAMLTWNIFSSMESSAILIHSIAAHHHGVGKFNNYFSMPEYQPYAPGALQPWIPHGRRPMC